MAAADDDDRRADADRGDDEDANADVDADTIVHLPIESTLDLHAFSPRDIVSIVNEHIHAAHAAGLREVRLIHGRGHGIQRGRVQSALEQHPLVVEFWDAPESHLGATIARLRD
jgi:DNA-nicking Smr family endonuclease